MSSNSEENQTKTEEKKADTSTPTTANIVTVKKDIAPPAIVVKTDNLLNFALTESKKKDENKKDDGD